METPTIVATGGIVLKNLIDVISPLIAEKYRRLIPLIAILMGLLWTILTLDAPIDQIILWGVLTGAGAVGVNEVTNIFKS